MRPSPGVFVMTKPQRSLRSVDIRRHELAYSLELARGASHISSTMTPGTMSVAIAEVMKDFVATHGSAHLGVFRELLAARLEKRGCVKGARAVAEAGAVVAPPS
jgi:hypothetical protein